MPDFAPIGTEIAAALLIILASVLAIVAKRIVGREDPAAARPEQVQVDLAPVLQRIDQLERQISQMIQSLMHERERVEHAREVKALEDEIDRLRLQRRRGDD